MNLKYEQIPLLHTDNKMPALTKVREELPSLHGSLPDDAYVLAEQAARPRNRCRRHMDCAEIFEGRTDDVSSCNTSGDTMKSEPAVFKPSTACPSALRGRTELLGTGSKERVRVSRASERDETDRPKGAPEETPQYTKAYQTAYREYMKVYGYRRNTKKQQAARPTEKALKWRDYWQEYQAQRGIMPLKPEEKRRRRDKQRAYRAQQSEEARQLRLQRMREYIRKRRGQMPNDGQQRPGDRVRNWRTIPKGRSQLGFSSQALLPCPDDTLLLPTPSGNFDCSLIDPLLLDLDSSRNLSSSV